MSASIVLAASGEGAKAGPIGLAVILLLCVACYFLFKSMSKHMKEVRENFPTDDAPGPAATPVGAPGVQRAEIIRTDAATGRPALPPTGDDDPDRDGIPHPGD